MKKVALTVAAMAAPPADAAAPAAAAADAAAAAPADAAAAAPPWPTPASTWRMMAAISLKPTGTRTTGMLWWAAHSSQASAET